MRCSVNHAIEMFMDRTVSLLTLVSGLLPLPDPRQLVACFCCSRSRWGGRSTGMGWVGFPGFPCSIGSSSVLLISLLRLGRQLDDWGSRSKPSVKCPSQLAVSRFSFLGEMARALLGYSLPLCVSSSSAHTQVWQRALALSKSLRCLLPGSWAWFLSLVPPSAGCTER